MPESLACAVCGSPVGLDMDHHVVNVEHKRTDDRDEQDQYILHDRCAMAIFDGWRSP